MPRSGRGYVAARAPGRLGLLASAVAAVACSSHDPSAKGTGSGSEPAVMVAVATRSPEGMNMYVGAYPTLPEEPQLADMVETVDGQKTAPMQRKLVRIDDEVSAPLQGIPKSAVFSTLNYRLDDELYMLMSEGSPGPANDARSTLYRITDDGAELALTTSGDIWSIGRIR